MPADVLKDAALRFETVILPSIECLWNIQSSPPIPFPHLEM